MPNPIALQDWSPAAAAIYRYSPFGYVQITVTGTATLLSALSATAGLTLPDPATMALIAVSGGKVRWRDDGTAPTAALGMPVDGTSSTLEFQYSGNLATIQFILSSGSPVLDVSFYK